MIRFIFTRLLPVILLLPVSVISAAAAVHYGVIGEPSVQPMRLRVDLGRHTISVTHAGRKLASYSVAGVASPGRFFVDQISWTQPPRAAVASGEPGSHAIRWAHVKVFSAEGGSCLSADVGLRAGGCLYLTPGDAASLALTLIEAAGVPRGMDLYGKALEKGEVRTVRLPRPISIIVSR